MKSELNGSNYSFFFMIFFIESVETRDINPQFLQLLVFGFTNLCRISELTKKSSSSFTRLAANLTKLPKTLFLVLTEKE